MWPLLSNYHRDDQCPSSRKVQFPSLAFFLLLVTGWESRFSVRHGSRDTGGNCFIVAGTIKEGSLSCNPGPSRRRSPAAAVRPAGLSLGPAPSVRRHRRCPVRKGLKGGKRCQRKSESCLFYPAASLSSASAAE